MKIPDIITARLKIRNYTPADMDFAMSIWNDPEMGKYMPDPTFDTVTEEYRKSMETLNEDEECCYLISESVENGEKIGTCSFIPSADGLTYDFGCCVHITHWNQGYATEMIQAMIDYAVAHGAKKITAPVNKENGPSNAVMRKLGFQIVGETSCKKWGTDLVFEEHIYELSV